MGDGAPEASIKYPRIPCALNTCALLAFSQLWLRRGRKLGFPLPRACILLRGPALDSPSQSPTRSQTGHTGFPCNLPAIAPYSGYRAYAPPPDLLTHCLFNHYGQHDQHSCPWIIGRKLVAPLSFWNYISSHNNLASSEERALQEQKGYTKNSQKHEKGRGRAKEGSLETFARNRLITSRGNLVFQKEKVRRSKECKTKGS